MSAVFCRTSVTIASPLLLLSLAQICTMSPMLGRSPEISIVVAEIRSITPKTLESDKFAPSFDFKLSKFTKISILCANL